jgi:DNA polymerase-1
MEKKKKTLYLIDGANYVFRAYYAIRGLSNSKGFPTNALYGFTQMLLSLLRDEKPDHVAVIFDRPEPTFREKLYEEYKANRSEPPDELVEQFPYFVPIVKALGIPVFDLAGYEADDLIGTIAKRYASEDLEVVIVSGDKDLMQLVGDDVSILDTMKNMRTDEKGVHKRFGVKPEQVVDVLGLAGDSTDNIPGLPGVGPKTATKLIEKYGSIENLIDHAEELKPAIQEKLKEFRDQVLMSKKLATIETEVPLEIDWDDLAKNEPHQDKLHELFQEFEFTKLLSELAPKTSLEPTQHRLVDDTKALNEVCENIRAAGKMAIDIDESLTGLALAWSPGKAAYVPMGHSLELGEKQLNEKTVIEAISPFFADPKIAKIAYDSKSIRKALKHCGVEMCGLESDVMLAAYLIEPAGQLSLDALSARYLDHQMTQIKAKRFADVDLQRACEIKSEAADVILQMGAKLMPKLKQENLDALYHDLEMPLIDVLLDMEMAGIKVDAAKLSELSRDFAVKLKGMEGEIFEEAGEEFNINSPKQLGFILFEKLKLPGAKKTKTGYSTSQDILDDLAVEYRLPELVLSYRAFSKLKSTYIDALPQLIDPKTGRIHTTFNQTVTATGRLSSSDPNLQNIPIRRPEGKLIRASFIADDGCVFVDADYSQIELRVLAHLTEDKALIEAFNEGIDVHAVTASGIFGKSPEKVGEEERGVGKTVNFATIYGQSAFGLARQLKIEVGEAARYIEGYFKKYPKVEEYREEVLDRAKKKGYVETLYGRRRYLPDIKSSNAMLKALAERMAFNTVFQGTAADIIKRAMLTIHHDLPSVSRNSKMLLQVHDELLFEVPKGDAESVREFVKEKMESAAELSVPLIVDVGIGPNWAEAK